MVNCFWKNFCLNPNLSFAVQATLFLHINYQVLIPMCHPLMIQKCSVDFELDEENLEITAICTAKTEGQTGVEMEALTGVNVALLTIYDMCKAIDKSMELTDIHLVEKSGGKSGLYRNPKE